MNREYTVKSVMVGVAIIVGTLCMIYGKSIKQYYHNTNVEYQRYWDSAIRGDSASCDDTAPTTEYAQKKSHNTTKLNDKVSAKAYEYKQSHPDAKFVKLDFSTGYKAKEGYHERLLDKPDIESVDRVFYVDSDGKVASGDKYDYHEALKSDSLVYVFTK